MCADLHVGIDRAVTVGLAGEGHHPARLGGNDSFVPTYIRERSAGAEAGQVAVDQPWVDRS